MDKTNELVRRLADLSFVATKKDARQAAKIIRSQQKQIIQIESLQTAITLHKDMATQP